ncbi:alpha-ketoglutarate-dependent dioxygenase AlkB family protein [Kaarinaea lacus]
MHANTKLATPFDCGDLSLVGKLYSAEKCMSLLEELTASINWHEDYCIVHGRKFYIPRLQAWYADEGIQYSYSNNLLKTHSWQKSLLAIKRDIEQQTAQLFNSVLVTYYRDGNDHVGWHADDEEELGTDPVIASLSLGASRTFQYRHKREDLTGSISLTNGDLLLMHPDFQVNWEHRAPSEPAVNAPRINLTFRKVVPLD